MNLLKEANDQEDDKLMQILSDVIVEDDDDTEVDDKARKELDSAS
jgi:hypothetical protein